MGIEGAGTWRPDILFVRTSALQRPAGWTMAQPDMLRYKIQSEGKEKTKWHSGAIWGSPHCIWVELWTSPKLGEVSIHLGIPAGRKEVQNVKQSNVKSWHPVHKRQCGRCSLRAWVPISVWTGWLEWNQELFPLHLVLSRVQLPSWGRAIRFSRLQRHLWGQSSSAASTIHHEIKHLPHLYHQHGITLLMKL